jgi:hypothetical protein
MGIFQGKATNSGGDGQFEIPPAGSNPAVLVAIIDLGTHQEEMNFEGEVKYKDTRKCFVVWELTSEKMTGMKDRNHVIGKEYTLSYHAKAGLRKMLESMRGSSYAEGAEINIAKALGGKCLLNIVHNQSKTSDKTYAKVDNVSPVVKGLTVAPPQNTPFLWEIDGKEPPPDYDWLPRIFGKEVSAKIAESHEAKRGLPSGDQESTTTATTTVPTSAPSEDLAARF